MNLNFNIFLLLLFFLLTSCETLFFHPTREFYVNPKKLNLEPSENWITSQNGNKINSWFFESEEKPALGTIVFFHGNAENISSHYLNLAWITKEKYNLFIFDYQGFGKSEGLPSTQNSVEDGIAALKWVYLKDKNSPIIVYGSSLGGAISLKSTLEIKKEIPIKAFIADSTFASYRKMGQNFLSRFLLTYPFQGFSYLLISDEFSAANEIKNLHPIPLLVIHGNEDNIVESKEGLRIFESAVNPKELWIVDGGYHTDVFHRHNMKYRAQFLEYLKKNVLKN